MASLGALTDIMERVYQILNTKVGTPQSGQSALVLTSPSQTILLKSQRYYPRSIDLSKLPLLAATFGEGRFAINYGHDSNGYVVSTAQTITIWAFVNPMMSGADGNKETLIIAEPLVDALKACFLARSRLQLATDSDKLDCLTKDIVFTNHSELTVGEKETGILSFALQIEYDEYITRI